MDDAVVSLGIVEMVINFVRPLLVASPILGTAKRSQSLIRTRLGMGDF